MQTYGTAQFKLQARMRVRRMRLAVRYKHFSKLCDSVGNCTGILRAIHTGWLKHCSLEAELYIAPSKYL